MNGYHQSVAIYAYIIVSGLRHDSLYWRATIGFQLEKGVLVSREINYCIIVSCLLNFSNFCFQIFRFLDLLPRL